jgi:NADH:ubiquinone oxidoreductase subunit E
MQQKVEVQICLGSSCFSRGNRETLESIKKHLKENNLEEKVSFKGKLCSNTCSSGPTITVNGIVFKEVRPNTAITLIENALKQIQ